MNQNISNDKILQKQQRQENQRKLNKDGFFDKNNFLKAKSDQEIFIHKIRNYHTCDTQLDFEKLIFNDNYIFKELSIIEKNKRLLTTHKRRKNRIFELFFNSSWANNSSKIRIYYKFREKKIWRNANSLLIDSFDTSEVEQVNKKYLKKKITFVILKFHFFDFKSYFYTTCNDEKNIVFLISKDNRRDFDEPIFLSKIRAYYNTK